jgi:4-hydroxy-L-threonine phosphate dehydrogenase PdxA
MKTLPGTYNSSSLVTLPVSKELIMKAGMEFQRGIPKNSRRHFRKKVFMCMYHTKFSVIPLTNHVPLAQVPRKLYEVSVPMTSARRCGSSTPSLTPKTRQHGAV